MLKTNKDRLIETAVEGVVQPASGRGFSVTWNGKPKNSIGTASINYTATIGDPVYKWADADHVEPDVTIQGRDKESASDCALASLARAPTCTSPRERKRKLLNSTRSSVRRETGPAGYT